MSDQSNNFQSAPDESKLVKICFEFEQDEDGWPPYRSESLWAEHVGGDDYKLHNVPIFARDVAIDDIVTAIRNDDGILTSKTFKAHGGKFTTVVLIMKEVAGQAHETLRAFLKADERYQFEWGFDVMYSICCPIEMLGDLQEFLEAEYENLWVYFTPKFPTEEQWAAFESGLMLPEDTSRKE